MKATSTRSALDILRARQAAAAAGVSKSWLYERIAEGLWPPGVRIGPRIVGWTAHEVATLNAARVAGKPDHEIRALVAQLVEARATTHA